VKWLNCYRAAALAIVIVTTALLMLFGKQHIIIIENKAYEESDLKISPFPYVLIKIPGEDDIEILEDGSDYVEPIGPAYTLELVIPSEEGNDILIKKKFFLWYKDKITINAAKLALDENKKLKTMQHL
jgi:hypothetical protein